MMIIVFRHFDGTLLCYMKKYVRWKGMEMAGISDEVYEKLLAQLVTIEERKAKLGKHSGLDRKRSGFIGMLDRYEHRLKELIESAVHTESGNTAVPFAVIGSEVEVCDKDSGEMITYRITAPEAFETEGNDVTIMSPIGQELLMKEVGDSVQVKTPMGLIYYEVRSIALNAEHDIKSIFSYLN